MHVSYFECNFAASRPTAKPTAKSTVTPTAAPTTAPAAAGCGKHADCGQTLYGGQDNSCSVVPYVCPKGDCNAIFGRYNAAEVRFILCDGPMSCVLVTSCIALHAFWCRRGAQIILASVPHMGRQFCASTDTIRERSWWSRWYSLKCWLAACGLISTSTVYMW
jgi:hypothetical protein